MKYLITFSYDGTLFYGYQKQLEKRTVQGEIEHVLSKILNSNINISASGRTDAKVHALNQKAHFETLKKVNLKNLKKSMNSLLPNDIYVKKINKVDNNFHARFSVVSKEYEYRINIGEYNPFLRNYVYQYNKKVNIKLIEEASKYFIGTHNFKTFTKTVDEDKDFVRTINYIKIRCKNKILYININANGFMRYMVRNIIGTLLAVSEEKLKPSDILDLINKENRIYAFKTANPEGLYLKDVYYK
ncbi:MAG: tRNA pseudouridine(38-40) synthase TruA [Clostridium sp.]|nr:tRNA pseudouridine(38-40) synthase TruA [Clostridium sp.]MCM1443923.1 tRNA pseudouridine(38-40) synthase TruA [Candidatus Amulumruptor caecigallinarius]